MAYTLVETAEEALKVCKEIDLEKPIFIDTETDGLFGNIVTIQVFQDSWEYPAIFLAEDFAVKAIAIKSIIAAHLVGHNISYDLSCLDIIPKDIDDIMLMSKIAFPEIKEFGLDKVTNHFLGDLYSALDKKSIRKTFKSGVKPTNDMLEYAALDVVVLSKLYKLDRLLEAKKSLFYIISMKNILYAIDYQRNGLLIDTNLVQKEIEDTEAEIKANLFTLGSLNPNSPKQVKEALGIESSDKENLLKKIAKNDRDRPTAEAVWNQRRAIKKLGYLNDYNKDKVVTRFNTIGTVTGRFSSSGGILENGINAQQIPRGLQYLFHQPIGDTVVIHADFSTAELRAATAIMREPVMYKELKDGIDLHKAAASMARRIPIEQVTKAQRQEGKTISFGLIFGMSSKTFIDYAFTNFGVVFTEGEATEIARLYKDKYRNINNYHKFWWNNYKTTPVVSALGNKTIARLGTDAINFAIQASIAETTKLSVHYLIKAYPETIRYIFNVVHDAIYLRVPKEQAEKYKKALHHSMTEGWNNICKSSLFYYKDIPMPVDIEVIYEGGK